MYMTCCCEPVSLWQQSSFELRQTGNRPTWPFACRAGLKAKKMKMDDLKELGEMAAKLKNTARKLSPGLKQDELLQDIDRFRAQLSTQLSVLKAKAK